MGMGFGIAALIVLVLSLGIPIYGNFITLIALLFAAFSALGGSKAWPIALVAAGGVKLFFLSPSWMILMAGDQTYLWITIGALAVPLLAMMFRGRSRSASRDNDPEFDRSPPQRRAQQNVDVDVRDWDRITNKDDPEQLQEYLLRHPQGRFSEMARMKLDKAGITPVGAPPAATEPQARTSAIPDGYASVGKHLTLALPIVLGAIIVLGLLGGGYYWMQSRSQTSIVEEPPAQDVFTILPYAGEQMHAREAGSRLRALPFARPDIEVMRETVEHEPLNITGWADQTDGHWYQVRLDDGRFAWLKATLAISATTLARATAAAHSETDSIAAPATASTAAISVLRYEQPMATVLFRQIAPQQFVAEIQSPAGLLHTYDMVGDEWRFRMVLDAQSTQIESLQSRWMDRNQAGRGRNIHELGASFRWQPMTGVAARSVVAGAYMPMADGARYEVRLTRSGLVTRPLNQAAVDATNGRSP